MRQGQLWGVTRFAVVLHLMSVKASMAQRGAFVMQVLLMALNNAIFFSFWIVLLRRVSRIRGYGLADVLALYGTVACGFGLGVVVAGGVRFLARLIEEGELDSFLAQPKPTLLYALGRRSQASGIGDVLSGAVMLAMSGRVHLATIPLVVAAIVGSALVLISSGVMFHSLAFWLGRVEATARQLFESLITFSLYPEPLFGGAIRLLLFTLVPAGFVGYVPVRLVRDPSLLTVAELVVGAAAYTLASAWMFSRGLRSYCGGSRFEAVG